jgi:tetratricopeptide (TPR) repeat protein
MGMMSLLQASGQDGRVSWIVNRRQYLNYIAMQDYSAKRYPEALQKYKKILEMYPSDPKALQMARELEKQK